MQNSGDEMELYAAVNKKFREIFSNQEQMRTFKTYDAVEVNRLKHKSRFLKYFVK